MAAHEILTEADRLHSVSRNLEQLAVHHEPMAEALAVLAGTLRQSATMLEVMVEVRLGGAINARAIQDKPIQANSSDVKKQSN
jgi:hypothetical protein